MKGLVRRIKGVIPVFEVLLTPFIIVGAVWFRVAKYVGIKKLPITRYFLFKVGVFPVVDHYYEPLFDFRKLKFDSGKRSVPGIDFNVKRQLELIDSFDYADELISMPIESDKAKDSLSYYYHNGSFPSGDAELYYSIIRKLKPKKIIEVGAGFSTRMCFEALQKNREEDSDYYCELVCIEPYEMSWLEEMDITLIREKVEDVDKSVFQNLNANDILFIDSSHMIRPEGDVNTEILEILPLLKSGVLIHFHDIFSPMDYPKKWLLDEYRMWNEQYLLEAFLSFNSEFQILAAMNFLKINYANHLASKFPVLNKEDWRMPGSFWIERK